MYDDGLGVPQDYSEAVTWYRLAAEQNTAVVALAVALYVLAALVWRGRL